MTELARDWQIWAASNLLRGIARAEIEARLAQEGIDASIVKSALDALLASPVFAAAQPFARDAKRWAMTAKLHETLERESRQPLEIERRDVPSAEEFFERYYVTGRPVILRGLVTEWPAYERWSLDALVDRFGDTEISITRGRDEDRLYGATLDRPSEKLSFRDFVRRIEAASSPTNAFYLVAQNRALDGPLRGMLDDIAMPDGWMSPAGLGASLWMGPAGTVTRLHHDIRPVLTCHVRGRKRWRLVPPMERTLLERVSSTHTTLDPETDPMTGTLVKDFVVEPGEAIFVPSGWWHHVRALEPSITVSLTGWGRADTSFFRLGG